MTSSNNIQERLICMPKCRTIQIKKLKLNVIEIRKWAKIHIFHNCSKSIPCMNYQHTVQRRLESFQCASLPIIDTENGDYSTIMVFQDDGDYLLHVKSRADKYPDCQWS
eukprot:735063_1